MPGFRIDRLEGLYQEVKAYRSLQDSSRMLPSRDGFGVREPNEDFRRSALQSAQTRVMAQLRSAGFKDAEEFEKALVEFLSNFQDVAVVLAIELLERFQLALRQEHIRYQSEPAAAALHQALGQTRLKEYGDRARASEHEARSIRPDPELHRYMPGHLEMKARRQHIATEERRLAEAELAKAAREHPLLNHRDLDTSRLANASPSEVRTLMLEYIQARGEDIEETRKNIVESPTLIFKLDVLLRAAYGAMSISPGSIQDLVIQDRIQTIRGREAFAAIALGVLALGAGLLSAGSGTVAVLSLGLAGGIGVSDALRSFRQYEMESAAHGARLLSEDPSLGWVVLAVVGAGVDLAVAAKVIKAMTPSVLLFNKSGDLLQLENGLKAIPQLSGDLRMRLVAAAREESQFQTVVRQSAPKVPPQANPGRGLFGKQSPAPSGPLSPQLQQMYLRELESKWFRTKLSAYAKLLGKDPIDWDALVKMVRTSEFREYATVKQMLLSGGYAGYAEGRLVLGMSRLIREIPVLGRSAIQHELVHVYQELSMGMLRRESTVGRLPYMEVLKAETSANLFGSPALILTFVGFIVVVDGAAIYFYQELAR